MPLASKETILNDFTQRLFQNVELRKPALPKWTESYLRNSKFLVKMSQFALRGATLPHPEISFILESASSSTGLFHSLHLESSHLSSFLCSAGLILNSPDEFERLTLSLINANTNTLIGMTIFNLAELIADLRVFNLVPLAGSLQDQNDNEFHFVALISLIILPSDELWLAHNSPPSMAKYPASLSPDDAHIDIENLSAKPPSLFFETHEFPMISKGFSGVQRLHFAMSSISDPKPSRLGSLFKNLAGENQTSISEILKNFLDESQKKSPFALLFEYFAEGISQSDRARLHRVLLGLRSFVSKDLPDSYSKPDLMKILDEGNRYLEARPHLQHHRFLKLLVDISLRLGNNVIEGQNAEIKSSKFYLKLLEASMLTNPRLGDDDVIAIATSMIATTIVPQSYSPSMHLITIDNAVLFLQFFYTKQIEPKRNCLRNYPCSLGNLFAPFFFNGFAGVLNNTALSALFDFKLLLESVLLLIDREGLETVQKSIGVPFGMLVDVLVLFCVLKSKNDTFASIDFAEHEKFLKEVISSIDVRTLFLPVVRELSHLVEKKFFAEEFPEGIKGVAKKRSSSAPALTNLRFQLRSAHLTPEKLRQAMQSELFSNEEFLASLVSAVRPPRTFKHDEPDIFFELIEPSDLIIPGSQSKPSQVERELMALRGQSMARRDVGMNVRDGVLDQVHEVGLDAVESMFRKVFKLSQFSLLEVFRELSIILSSREFSILQVFFGICFCALENRDEAIELVMHFVQRLHESLSGKKSNISFPIAQALFKAASSFGVISVPKDAHILACGHRVPKLVSAVLEMKGPLFQSFQLLEVSEFFSENSFTLEIGPHLLNHIRSEFEKISKTCEGLKNKGKFSVIFTFQ